MANMIKGFALSGADILLLKDKSFEILDTPTYKEFEDSATKEKKEKMLLRIRLSDNSEVDYYPNKTSQKMIMNRAGRNLDNWKGFKGKLYISKMLVSGKEKPVIFVE